MTYQECLAGIHSRKVFSSHASLERIGRLMARLGNPQNNLRCIHVAGTNGKGSVCALVDSALRAAGYRVGLFTSPYLVEFCERIRVNFQPVSQKMLISAYETVMREESALETAGFEPVNEFELVTALGFLIFDRMQVDYAIIEVGLGGRWDATNIIQAPEVVCITPVSLDHTAVLGDTIAEIAWEKAGIIKKGCPVVVAPQHADALEILCHTAQTQCASLILVGLPKLLSYQTSGIQFRYDNTDITIPLLGRHQMHNTAAAWEVCKLLQLPPDQVASGFSMVAWPGRLQYIEGNPDILIDAGHNPAGILALCNSLDELFPGRGIITIMAMMRDKDYAHCIPLVANRSQVLIATTVSLPRSLPPEELAAEAEGLCTVLTAPSISAGIEHARALAKQGQLILVCGSVYAAGEAQKTI